MDVSLYLRQSLDLSGEGAAVDRQEQECRAYAQERGLRITEVFVDNDVSATSGVVRPEFERLLKSRPKAILTWHQDRLLRLIRDLERVIELDIPVYTVKAGNLDFSNPAMRAMTRTLAVWSQYETEQKAVRQKAAHRQRAAAGIPWGTTRAFGFKPGNIEHEPAEAEIVRGMYADLLAGVSQARIAAGLMDRGVLTSKGGERWTQGTVRAILMHPRNAGLISYTPRGAQQEIVGPGNWQPIVEETTWRAAVAKMTSQPRKGGPQRRYLLTGLAKCGVCDALMRVGVVGSSKVYTCSKGQHVGRNLRALEEYITQVVLERLARPDAVDLVMRDDHVDLQNLHAEARDARAALDALAVMFAEGKLTLTAFEAGTLKATERLQAIDSQLVDNSRVDRLAGLIGRADLEAAWMDLDIARQRSVVDALMTVRILRTVRGGRFRPDDIAIEWKAKAE